MVSLRNNSKNSPLRGLSRKEGSFAILTDIAFSSSCEVIFGPPGITFLPLESTMVSIRNNSVLQSLAVWTLWISQPKICRLTFRAVWLGSRHAPHGHRLFMPVLALLKSMRSHVEAWDVKFRMRALELLHPREKEATLSACANWIWMPCSNTGALLKI